MDRLYLQFQGLEVNLILKRPSIQNSVTAQLVSLGVCLGRSVRRHSLAKQRLVSSLLLIGTLCLCSGCASTLSYDHHGMEREYIFYKPSDLPAGAPLVIGLHGYGGRARTTMWYIGMNRLADEKGFAIAYPKGSRDRFGKTHWNANLTISDRVDDVEFLTELAKTIQENHDLNPKNTFVFGVSNGGFMSYTLACNASDTFGAAASVIGTMSGYDWTHCEPSRPISILQITGLDDEVVPPDGSMSLENGWGGAPAIAEVVTFWEAQNACVDRDQAQLPPSTSATFCTEGVGGSEVWFYEINDFGHGWPKSVRKTGINAAEVVWQLFESSMDHRAKP